MLTLSQAWAEIATAYETMIATGERPEQGLARCGFCLAVGELEDAGRIDFSIANAMLSQIDGLLFERGASDGLGWPILLAQYDLEGAKLRALLAGFLAEATKDGY